MLSKRITTMFTHRGHQIIITQEKDLTAQYVIFDHKEFDKDEERIVQHIVSVGNYKSSSVNIITEIELKNLINHIIKLKRIANARIQI